MMANSASIKRCALIVGVLLLSGCSLFGKKTGNEPMELVDFKSTVKLQKAWSKGVGSGQGEGFTSLTPAIDGENIYTVDYLGHLTVLNANTGNKVFSKKINQPKNNLWQSTKSLWSDGDPRFHLIGGVFAGNGLILVASQSGEIIALDQANGDELWRAGVSGEVLAPPQSNGSVVTAQTINGKLFGFNAKSGKQLWTYENTAPNLTLRGTPSPVITDSTVFAGFSNGRVMAFNPENGIILWEQRIALPKGRSELDRMVDIHASPLLVGGILYAASYQGRIMAMARGTGSVLWGQDASTANDLAVAANTIYMSDSNGAVVAFDATNGTVRWKNEEMLRRHLNAPQILGDYVGAVDFKGYLHILNQDDGKFAARLKVGGKGVRAPMLSHGNMLYVYTNKGKLIAYQVKSKN